MSPQFIFFIIVLLLHVYLDFLMATIFFFKITLMHTSAFVNVYFVSLFKGF